MKKLITILIVFLAFIKIAKAQLLTSSDYFLIIFLVLGAIIATAMIIMIINHHIRTKEKVASDPRVVMLKKYIRHMLDKGYSKKTIIDAAIKSGWPEAIVEAALKSL